MVGDNGPRLLSARLDEHRCTKTWWPAVRRIDAADCGDHGRVMEEEVFQIAQLRPDFNIRDVNGSRRLPDARYEEATGWPAGNPDWDA